VAELSLLPAGTALIYPVVSYEGINWNRDIHQSQVRDTQSGLHQRQQADCIFGLLSMHPGAKTYSDRSCLRETSSGRSLDISHDRQTTLPITPVAHYPARANARQLVGGQGHINFVSACHDHVVAVVRYRGANGAAPLTRNRHQSTSRAGSEWPDHPACNITLPVA